MDIGQSDNTFSKNTSTSDTGSTGLFKIGDYDKPTQKKTNNEGGLLDQATNTVKNEAQAVADKLTSTDNKKQ
ncbi:MAG: hypothetical protein JSY10_30080 [Paenibacillus sp.]|uniref:Uncharacterized protein n=1 Tax=Thamnidium elegans TaxID=101142 RepID=A0A8H7VNX8_9FUNG|nr:hypothetical protein INT48_008705 [Thamnidium elegans]MBM6388145.1 hypothetical protein [Paenibacillus sp.]